MVDVQNKAFLLRCRAMCRCEKNYLGWWLVALVMAVVEKMARFRESSRLVPYMGGGVLSFGGCCDCLVNERGRC